MYTLYILFEKCLCAIPRYSKRQRRVYFIKRSNFRDWGNTFRGPWLYEGHINGFISCRMYFLTCVDREYSWQLNLMAEGRHIFVRKQHINSNQECEDTQRPIRGRDVEASAVTMAILNQTSFSFPADLESVYNK